MVNPSPLSYSLRRRILSGWIVIFGTVLLGIVAAGCEISIEEKSAEYIHADFLINDDTLTQLIAELPLETQEQIWRLPQYFIELLFATLNELPPESMRLVDKTHALPASYQPDDLVVLNQYQPVLLVRHNEMELSASVVPDLLAMSAEAARIGIEIPISSAYRSYDHQVLIYNNNLMAYGAEETENSVARSGHSQHQLGTTIDFGSISDGFADTAAGQWLLANSWRFGFSLSYPRGRSAETGYKYESWHYRYIGRSAAQLERYFFDSNQSLLFTYLEEYRPLLTDLLTPIVGRY